MGRGTQLNGLLCMFLTKCCWLTYQLNQIWISDDQELWCWLLQEKHNLAKPLLDSLIVQIIMFWHYGVTLAVKTIKYFVVHVLFFWYSGRVYGSVLQHNTNRQREMTHEVIRDILCLCMFNILLLPGVCFVYCSFMKKCLLCYYCICCNNRGQVHR